MNTPHYTMVIEWSNEDSAYLVSFPEWTGYLAQPVTHGDTYEEAARKGLAVLENLQATAAHEGVPLPVPKASIAS